MTTVEVLGLGDVRGFRFGFWVSGIGLGFRVLESTALRTEQ